VAEIVTHFTDDGNTGHVTPRVLISVTRPLWEGGKAAIPAGLEDQSVGGNSTGKEDAFDRGQRLSDYD